MKRLITALLFLVAIASNLGADYYRGKWMGFMLIFLWIFGLKINETLGLWAALLFSYLMFSGLMIVEWFAYAPVNPYDLQALKLYACWSMLKLLLFVAPVVYGKFDREHFRQAGGLLSCVFVIVSLFQVGLAYFLHGCAATNTCGGPLGNPSLNASMIATALPILFGYVLRKYAIGFLILATLASLVSNSSIGLGLVVAFIGLEFFPWKALRKPRSAIKAAIGTVIAGAATFGLGAWHFGVGKLFSDSDRFALWALFIKAWMRPANLIFGMGFGTFGVFSINIQEEYKMRLGNYWIFMHNDWLELFFVGGAVGLFLALMVYAKALHGLWKKKLYPEFKALILFGLFMTVNFPLHVGLTSAFGLWLVSVALFKERDLN